jgi:formiminotetrahydrofolate cyclodeaminase
MLSELTLSEFAARTAAREAVPGGGSVSALAAALAAALAEMAARFTVDRKGFEDRQAQMNDVIERAAALRQRLLNAVDEDAAAYGLVLKAFALPKGSDVERHSRAEAIQAGLKSAALTPLAVAQAAGAVQALCAAVVRGGNPNTVTDGAVGALMARSAALGALLNVKINLGSITDGAFVSRLAGEVRCLEEQVTAAERETMTAFTL